MYVLESKPGVFGVPIWAVLGMFVLIGVFCMKLALAEDTVYLRTMMPFDSIAAGTEEDAPKADVIDAVEQRLIDMLYQDDQDAVYNVVRNDERWRVVRMRVTAYCACSICCGKFSDGVTACNHRIQPGDVFVAADNAYRFRTDMIVPGYNRNQPVQVLDRGRVIKGNRLDVFFHSHEVAKKWGTRSLDVLVREN